ncbi:hypothetical protein [Allochromatium tepidum]|uniref:Uncharacterized protein n=1 Tax=Allochromatium tepidum TaxID=553982 RepID=A0ABM7QK42_9GAMM|nr:hypothetical protein [Allochromatium tepidum]BCU06088.1 hypothetical protein Atep_07650 [Allochromatium tepidum]
MVWTGQSLFHWHANTLIAPNEKLTEDQKRRVGYFVLHEGRWRLVNEGLPDLLDVSNRTAVPVGDRVELKDGQQILPARGEGGRLVVVQMVKA